MSNIIGQTTVALQKGQELTQEKPAGYAAEQQKITDYGERYPSAGYYGRLQPSQMCYEVMKLCPAARPLRLLDVACGEGKSAVFFAQNGYQVTAYDAACTRFPQCQAPLMRRNGKKGEKKWKK